MTDSASLDRNFWEERYQTGGDRWDLAQPAPPFVHLLDSPNAPKPGRMIVLGMGRGHDALLFAERGFAVIGVDFAPSAIAAATDAANARRLKVEFLQRDIFDLLPEFAGQFDYVLEHTCFCAIALELRSAYVNLVRSLLRPDGELIALFWAHDRAGGPPFGVSIAELHSLFGSDFNLSLESVANSVAARQNEEYLGRLRVVS